MSGDTTNTSVWSGADVYIAPVGTVAPDDCTTAWGVGWEAVGLLDGEEGFTMSRDEDTAEHFAWGGVLVKKTRSKHKRTIKFVALEDNDVVFELVNPGSSRAVDGVTGAITSTVKIPQSAEFAIGFEMTDGNSVKRRTVKRATIEETGEYKESESEPAVYEITVVILPETDGELFAEVWDKDTTAP